MFQYFCGCLQSVPKVFKSITRTRRYPVILRELWGCVGCRVGAYPSISSSVQRSSKRVGLAGACDGGGAGSDAPKRVAIAWRCSGGSFANSASKRARSRGAFSVGGTSGGTLLGGVVFSSGFIGVWSSSEMLRDQEVAGSNPVSPIVCFSVWLALLHLCFFTFCIHGNQMRI